MIANVVLFSSPNLVLFGSLFLIFFFSFSLIKKLFLESVSVEIVNNKNFYSARYDAVRKEIDHTIAHFEIFLTLPQLITVLFTTFKTNVAVYNCMKIPNNNNYLFIYLEKHYLLIRSTLNAGLRVNFISAHEKNRFIERLARKAF